MLSAPSTAFFRSVSSRKPTKLSLTLMGATEKTVAVAEPGAGGPGASAAARCQPPYPSARGGLCAGWSRWQLFCLLTAPASLPATKTREGTSLEICTSHPMSLPSGQVLLSVQAVGRALRSH